MPKLTEIGIKALKPPLKGQTVHWDDLPGFGIRLSQGGTKTFILVHGRERTRTTIGRFPIIGLSEARQAARELLAEKTLSKTLNRPPPSKLVVSEAIDAFLEHSERRNRPRTTADYKRLLERHFPSGKLRDITKQKLLAKLSSLAATPAEQSHALTAFNVFLNWCSISGHIESNPLLGIRGLGHIADRDRVLTQDELAAVVRRARSYPYPFGTIVLLCVLTAQRRGEIAQLRREYIDGDTVTLPASVTKNGREFTFPIGPEAQAALTTIPHKEGLLFPGRKDGVWRGWGKAKALFDEGLPVAPYTLHDLRRSAASTLAAIGTPPHIIERCFLNHISGPTFGGIAGIYNRHSYLDEARPYCLAYEEHIRSLTS